MKQKQVVYPQHAAHQELHASLRRQQYDTMVVKATSVLAPKKAYSK